MSITYELVFVALSVRWALEREADLAAKYQTFVLGSKIPMWIGEFGAFMTDASTDNWLRDVKRLFDKYQVGWAWWACLDPSGGNSIPDPILNPYASASPSQASLIMYQLSSSQRTGLKSAHSTGG